MRRNEEQNQRLLIGNTKQSKPGSRQNSAQKQLIESTESNQTSGMKLGQIGKQQTANFGTVTNMEELYGSDSLVVPQNQPVGVQFSQTDRHQAKMQRINQPNPYFKMNTNNSERTFNTNGGNVSTYPSQDPHNTTWDTQ